MQQPVLSRPGIEKTNDFINDIHINLHKNNAYP